MEKLKIKFITITLIIISVISCLFAFCACGRENMIEKEIIVGTTSNIENATRDEYAYDMLASGVSEIPLVAKSPKGEFSPLIASFSTNDSKSWTYTIIDGLKWSDGVKVTAEDIVFSLEYEGTESLPAFNAGERKGTYESYVYSEDKMSVTLNLNKTNVNELEQMTTFRIRPEHIYKNKAAEEITDDEARVTCGPYVLENYNKEAGALVFTINDHFPKKPNFDKITFKIFNNNDVMYLALKNGELDFVWNYSTGTPSIYQKILGGIDSVNFERVTASNCPAMLVFNNTTGFFADKNLRFAVSYVLNYESFKEYFGSIYAETPNRSFAPSALVGYKNTKKLESDLVKATEYMNYAGYVKVGNNWEKNGQKASFDLTVNAGKELHIGLAEYVKTQLENFGIEVNLEIVDGTSYNAKTSNKFAGESGQTISMEAAIMGFTAFGMQNLGDMYIDGNHAVQGAAQVFSEELSRIRVDMAGASTLDEYKEAAYRLQDFYERETPAVALYWDALIYVYSSKLSKLTLDGTFGLNNCTNWFTMKKAK